MSKKQTLNSNKIKVRIIDNLKKKMIKLSLTKEMIFRNMDGKKMKGSNINSVSLSK